MGFLYNLWSKATECKALELSSGALETLFFESVYRVTYFAGWSILDNTLLHNVYNVIVKLAVICLICCEVWQLVSESANLDNIIDNVNVTLIHFMALYRYNNMRANKELYKNLASSMESPYFDMSTEKRKELVKFWAERNERFLKVLLMLGSCTLGAWHIYPLVDDIDYNLMVSARFPFDYKTPIRYPIFYLIVCIVFNYASLFVMMNDLIMQAHLMHLLCQYTILADCFEAIINDCMEDEKKEDHSHLIIMTEKFQQRYLTRLNDLVEQHKFILNNTMELKRSLSFPMLGQLAASAMLICFVSYQATRTAGISNVKFFMSVLYLMYNLFELFIFCKWCDEIKLQSENICKAVYCSGWERGLMDIPRLRARLLFVAMRARKPLVLTAGGLFDLSLVSYTTANAKTIKPGSGIVALAYLQIIKSVAIFNKEDYRRDGIESNVPYCVSRQLLVKFNNGHTSIPIYNGFCPTESHKETVHDFLMMELLSKVWKKLTHTKALDTASGNFERFYFELLYRVQYITGFSVVDRTPLYLLYSNTVKMMLILLGCSEIWHFVSIPFTIDTVIDGVNLILIQIGALYKYKTMLGNITVFKSLASAMRSPNFDLTTTKRRNIFELWGRRNEASLKLLLCLGTCTLVAWHIYPLVDDLKYNLMVVIRLPFDYQTPTLYPITYISTLIVFSYISYFVMVNDLIMQAHLMHLLCQFAVLNDCFKNIWTDCRVGLPSLSNEELHTLHLNQEFRQKYVKRLGSLVDQHNFIINNTLKLRDMLSAPMLVQLGVSTTLICSIGFQVATSVSVNLTKWLMSLLYLGYNMFGLYIICRWCEEVKIQSIKIGEAVYCSGWENGIATVPGVRTSILLILARANKPIALSGGGMYELSLMAYANMVKTSYSALTVLLRLR